MLLSLLSEVMVTRNFPSVFLTLSALVFLSFCDEVVNLSDDCRSVEVNLSDPYFKYFALCSIKYPSSSIAFDGRL